MINTVILIHLKVNYNQSKGITNKITYALYNIYIIYMHIKMISFYFDATIKI